MTTTLVAQDHMSARRDNSMTASIQKDPGWGDPVLISGTDVSKLEGLQGKKCLRVKKASQNHSAY